MAHGATHYTHWFVPMTGSTAEKHDSFLTPTGEVLWSGTYVPADQFAQGHVPALTLHLPAQQAPFGAAGHGVLGDGRSRRPRPDPPSPVRHGPRTCS